MEIELTFSWVHFIDWICSKCGGWIERVEIVTKGCKLYIIRFSNFLRGWFGNVDRFPCDSIGTHT